MQIEYLDNSASFSVVEDARRLGRLEHEGQEALLVYGYGPWVDKIAKTTQEVAIRVEVPDGQSRLAESGDQIAIAMQDGDLVRMNAIDSVASSKVRGADVDATLEFAVVIPELKKNEFKLNFK